MGCGSSVPVVGRPQYRQVAQLEALVFKQLHDESRGPLPIALPFMIGLHVQTAARPEPGARQRPPPLGAGDKAVGGGRARPPPAAQPSPKTSDGSKSAVANLEELLVERVMNDRRELAKLPGCPKRIPEKRSLRDMIEEAMHFVTRDAHPRINAELEKDVQSAGDKEVRKQIVERTVELTIHLSFLHEIHAMVVQAMEAAEEKKARSDSPPPATTRSVPDDTPPSAGTQAVRIPPPGPAPERNGQTAADDRGGNTVPAPARERAATTPSPNRAPSAQQPSSSATQPNRQTAPVELRYALPEGDWEASDDTHEFYWSEEQRMYYFPPAGHFFEPEAGMWYVPGYGGKDNEEEWMDGDTHERVLEEMAQRGEY